MGDWMLYGWFWLIGGVFVGVGSVLDLWLVWMLFCLCLVLGGWLDLRHLYDGWWLMLV